MALRAKARRTGALVWITALGVWLGSVQAREPGLPSGIAAPTARSDNPTTPAKVALGRLLFFDSQLSLDHSLSCASCHQPVHAFADIRARSIGITGEKGRHNAPSLLNVGYRPVLTWRNPEVRSLEAQALIPIFGSDPVEMGFAGQAEALWQRLQADPRYPPLFALAFPEVKPSELFSVTTLGKALAAYQRTLISFESRYDKAKRGDRRALSRLERRGLELFRSQALGCATCHGGITFDVPDQGVERQAGDIRIPSLRNAAITAPYMHDGRIPNLAQAIATPHGGQLHRDVALSRQEVKALSAFLGALTYVP
jgi:cytochrome c peroxidase